MKALRYFPRALILIAVSTLCPVVAQAALILDTFNSSSATTYSGVSAGSGKAVSLTMPASFSPGITGYEISSLQLRLLFPSGFSGSVSVALYSNDGSNTPGSPLATFTNPTFNANGTFQTYTFLPGSTFTLTNSSRYWIAMTSTSTGGAGTEARWQYNTTTPISDIGASYFAGVFTGGGENAQNPSTWTSASSVRNGFRLEAIAVPEPSVSVLLACAGMVALCRRRSPSMRGRTRSSRQP